MAVLKVKDTDGNVIEIHAIKGPQGEQGPQGIQGTQGPKGDKGDTGNSGVYIGTEEPIDANVWIQPDGETFVTEVWQFELEDGSIVTKEVVLK